MNVLFCNIAWMKYYKGVTDDDKPKNGGVYVKKNGYGNECNNFADQNGKCYGFVMLYGDMNLELHYKDAKKHSDSLKDLLIVWVATHDKNETKIVGWYKNATVYREEQSIKSFINEDYSIYYRIEALAENCYLLPEDQRTFPIQRASQTGKGTGMGESNIWYADSSFAQTVLIPKVIDYIDNYNGKFANAVYTNDILNAVISNDYNENDYKKLFDEGQKKYDVGTYEDTLESLKYFNTARQIKETPELLLSIARTLFCLSRYDKAIPLLEKCLEHNGNNIEAASLLIYCNDYIGNREKTIEYCNRIISLLGDSKDDIDDKIYYNCLMFDIYISQRNEKKAMEIVDKILTYSNDDAKKNVKEMKNIIKEEFKE